MGRQLAALGAALRRSLGLERAVETGTFRGDTSVALARVFPEVVTIELSPQLHRAAADRFARESPNVQAMLGHSATVLRGLEPCPAGTMYFLDGHWSTGPTAGVLYECPVIEELNAIGGGCGRDCIIIDDARLFAAAPPPPHNPDQWPRLMTIIDLLREQHPAYYLTVVADQVLAVPEEVKPAVDRYAQITGSWNVSATQLLRRAQMRGRMVLARRRVKPVA